MSATNNSELRQPKAVLFDLLWSDFWWSKKEGVLGEFNSMEEAITFDDEVALGWLENVTGKAYEKNLSRPKTEVTHTVYRIIYKLKFNHGKLQITCVAVKYEEPGIGEPSYPPPTAIYEKDLFSECLDTSSFSFKHLVFLSGPFFNDREIEKQNECIKWIMKDNRNSLLWVPREHTNELAEVFMKMYTAFTTEPETLSLLKAQVIKYINYDILSMAFFVVGLLPLGEGELDTGTIAEFGYAEAIRKPTFITGYDYKPELWGSEEKCDKKFWNLMLSKVVYDFEEVKHNPFDIYYERKQLIQNNMTMVHKKNNDDAELIRFVNPFEDIKNAKPFEGKIKNIYDFIIDETEENAQEEKSRSLNLLNSCEGTLYSSKSDITLRIMKTPYIKYNGYLYRQKSTKRCKPY